MIPSPDLTPAAPEITVTASGRTKFSEPAVKVLVSLPGPVRGIQIQEMEFSWRVGSGTQILGGAGGARVTVPSVTPWRDLPRMSVSAGTTTFGEVDGLPFGRAIHIRCRVRSVAGYDSPWTVAPAVYWGTTLPKLRVAHLEQPLGCRMANKINRGSERPWYTTIGEGHPPINPETGVVESLGRGFRGQFSWRWSIESNGVELPASETCTKGLFGAIARWRVEVYAGELASGTWGSLLEEANAGDTPDIVPMQRKRVGAPGYDRLGGSTGATTDTWDGLLVAEDYVVNPYGQYGHDAGYTFHLERNIRLLQGINETWGTGYVNPTTQVPNAEVESPCRIIGIRVGITLEGGGQVGGPPAEPTWSPISWQVNDWPSIGRGLSPIFTNDDTLQFAGTSFHDWASIKNPRPTNTWYLRVLGVQGSDPRPGATFGDAIPIYVADPVFGTPVPVGNNGFGDFSEQDAGEADYSGGMFLVQVTSLELHSKRTFKRHAQDPGDRTPSRFPAADYLTAGASANYGLCLADELSWDYNGTFIHGEPESIKFQELKERTGGVLTIVNPSTVGGIALPS